jgi:hypothetical protein
MIVGKVFMGRESRKNPEIVINLLLMILGLLVIVASLKLGFGTLKKPGPGLVPLLAGVIILVSSLLLVIPGWQKAENPPVFTKRELRVYPLLILVFAGWIIVIPYAGYLLGTFLATFFLAKIMNLEGWLRAILLSAGTTFFSYMIFDFWFYMDLPKGIWG